MSNWMGGNLEADIPEFTADVAIAAERVALSHESLHPFLNYLPIFLGLSQNRKHVLARLVHEL
jgi:hypothetical protein